MSCAYRGFRLAITMHCYYMCIVVQLKHSNLNKYHLCETAISASVMSRFTGP